MVLLLKHDEKIELPDMGPGGAILGNPTRRDFRFLGFQNHDAMVFSIEQVVMVFVTIEVVVKQGWCTMRTLRRRCSCLCPNNLLF